MVMIVVAVSCEEQEQPRDLVPLFQVQPAPIVHLFRQVVHRHNTSEIQCVIFSSYYALCSPFHYTHVQSNQKAGYREPVKPTQKKNASLTNNNNHTYPTPSHPVQAPKFCPLLIGMYPVDPTGLAPKPGVVGSGLISGGLMSGSIA
jgi:hypothetical protein